MSAHEDRILADAFEAGRLAAIRAEVERAMRDLTKDALHAAQEARAGMRRNLRHMREHRHEGTLYAYRWGTGPGWHLGASVGAWSRLQRRRRHTAGLLEASRRWLEATR